MGDAGGGPLRTLSPEELDRRDAMAAVLDGIIQLGGELPAETVERFAADFPAQAVVLLMRDAAADQTAVLRRLVREGPPELQRPAAAMLALAPPAGFAAELLRGTTLRDRIWVFLPGDGQVGTGSSSCCGAGGGTRAAAGWPEVGQYQLLNAPKDGEAASAVVVIPGVRPIAVGRTLGFHVGGRASACEVAWLNDRTRVELIAEMLGLTPEALGVEVLRQRYLLVRHEVEYRQKLAEVVAEREREIAAMKDKLAAKGLLSAGESADAEVRPLLLLNLVDGRSERSFSLGEITMRGVGWVEEGSSGSWAFVSGGG